MKVYHGSKNKFDFFEKRMGKNSTFLGDEEVLREGHFFTTNKNFASEFGNVTEWELDISNTLDLSAGFIDEDIVKLFVDDGWNEKFLINLATENVWEILDGENGKNFKSTITKIGYDSVKLSELNLNGDLVNSIVVFNANKIKKPKELSVKEFLSTKIKTPWSDTYFIEQGLQKEIFDYIKKNPFHDFGMSCQNESRRWAELLQIKFPFYCIEIHDGFFNNHGHTWIEINGIKFDPTASQFYEYPYMEQHIYDTLEIIEPENFSENIENDLLYHGTCSSIWEKEDKENSYLFLTNSKEHSIYYAKEKSKSLGKGNPIIVEINPHLLKDLRFEYDDLEKKYSNWKECYDDQGTLVVHGTIPSSKFKIEKISKKYQPIEFDLSCFLKHEEIKNLIIQNLNDSLLKKEWKNKPNRLKTTGHCYHASEAFMYLSGGNKIWIPFVGKDDSDSTHWWLKSKNKDNQKIVDVTENQYYYLGKLPPYKNGKAKGFQQQSFSCLNLMKNILLNLNIENKDIKKTISLINLRLKKTKKHIIK